MKRILIADDNEGDRYMLREDLDRWGYEVLSVHDGAQALERMQDPRGPSIAVLDHQMPKLDGVEVARRIRQSVPRPVHLILLTGSNAATLSQALLSGFDDFLLKPYDAHELRARIYVGTRHLRAKGA